MLCFFRPIRYVGIVFQPIAWSEFKDLDCWMVDGFYMLCVFWANVHRSCERTRLFLSVDECISKTPFNSSPSVWSLCRLDPVSTGARGPSCPCFLEPGTGTDGSPNLKPPTGHRTWSRLNGYHALIWGYLFLWYLFLCRSFNIHKTLHKSKAKQKEK